MFFFRIKFVLDIRPFNSNPFFALILQVLVFIVEFLLCITWALVTDMTMVSID
ncbi:unnamed protein product [Schistosoma margrebowiei]|uniref:Uncharacterized protein n=1 Tax=Schistosoma margrebowiei TaxID=48269 RepID=A0A183M7T7_9TREM|nr:unnamed protein product [Schistosoma margrebowiei]